MPTGPEPGTDTNSRLGVLPPDYVLVDRPLNVVLAGLRGTIPAPSDRGVTERGPDICKPRTSRDLATFTSSISTARSCSIRVAAGTREVSALPGTGSPEHVP